MGDALEVTTTYEDRADGINEVVHGVDIGGQVGEVWHGARGREETTEQEHTDHEEPHDEDGLLHRVAIVGDDEAQTAEEQGKEHRQKIN